MSLLTPFMLRASEASKIDCFKNLVRKFWTKNFNSSLKNWYFGALIFQEIEFFDHLKYNFKTSWPPKNNPNLFWMLKRMYSDNSVKNTVLRPNRQYKASTAKMASGILNRVIRVLMTDFMFVLSWNEREQFQREEGQFIDFQEILNKKPLE